MVDCKYWTVMKIHQISNQKMKTTIYLHKHNSRKLQQVPALSRSTHYSNSSFFVGRSCCFRTYNLPILNSMSQNLYTENFCFHLSEHFLRAQQWTTTTYPLIVNCGGGLKREYADEVLGGGPQFHSEHVDDSAQFVVGRGIPSTI